MVRVKNSVASKRKKKRLFKRAKGFIGDRKNHLRQTSDAVMRAMAFNYRDRKRKKRDFRRLWNIRIGVGSRINGLSYSKFICGLKRAECGLNRKMLAHMALHDPEGFKQVADKAKVALA
ncbi:MAG: 50S ribosomal protein L20 [Simkaniaceae bacterium]